MITMIYHGVEVVALPERDPKTNQWRIKFTICMQKRRLLGSKIFDIPESYLTQKEAIDRCWEYGQKIIDGELKDFSKGNL